MGVLVNMASSTARIKVLGFEKFCHSFYIDHEDHLSDIPTEQVVAIVAFLINPTYGSLVLIDEQEIAAKVPYSNDWDLVVQNPFEGIVEVLHSPTDKFQILLNGTFDKRNSWALHYTMRTGNNELFLQVSTRAIQQKLYTDVEEDTVYLQLLLITIASLVLVVFVVSIVFSCWWIKSRQDNEEDALASEYVDITDQVDLKHLCESASGSQLNQLANGRTSADGDIELLSLGQTFLGAQRPEEKLDELLCGTEYATFAALEEHQDTKVCEVSMPGTTHTQPRYTIAGANSNGSGGTLGTIIGIPTSVCPTASAVPSLPRDGLLLVSADNALTHTISNTADRTGNLLPGSSSTTGRTRHVAKEFLDETVLNTATRRKRSKNVVSPQTVQIASTGGFASLVPVPQPVILLPASGGAGADPNAAFLLASSTAGTVMRPMSPVHVLGTLDTGGATLMPSVMASLPQSNQCELHPTSSGGTLFVQVNSSHPPTAEQFSRLSPLPDAGTEVVSGSGLPVSVLTAPYVADELLAEMAACPQHSYLVRQQINKTFEASPPDASSPVTTYESPPTESATTTEASDPPKEPELDSTATSAELPIESIPPPDIAVPEHKSTPSSAATAAAAESACQGKQDKDTTKPSKSPRVKATGSSETLPRSMGSRPREEVESQQPESSATLPSGSSSGSGGAVTGRRSALKGGDRPGGGPKVSKHIRFTALSLVACTCLLTVAMASTPVFTPARDSPFSSVGSGVGARGDISWPVRAKNIIKFRAENASSLASARPTGAPPLWLHITVWLPRGFFPGEQQQQPDMAGSSASATGRPAAHHKAGRAGGGGGGDWNFSVYHRAAPKSIQLWLNKTSRTEVHLGPDIPRSAVEIFDATDTRWVQSTRVCRQRYACEHSCDPSAGHACICQRGYRPAGPEDRSRLIGYGVGMAATGLESVKGRVCLDVDECEDPAVRSECTRRGGVCTNRPGDFRCLCPSGHSCLPCDTQCPPGYWLYGNCSRGQPTECKRCSEGCPAGMYVARPCTAHSDLVCRACRPLCISEEFEFTPCKGSSNRECRRKDIIPEIVIPHQHSVWFEDQRYVKDVSFILTPDTQRRLLANRSVILDRGSGYQVRLEFELVNLEPILEPVNHSSSNDNLHFLASANQESMGAGTGDFSSRRWYPGEDSSRLGDYHSMHRANETLARLCPYPIPPLYHLTMFVHRNVTTATDPDPTLPGYRPILASCHTYEQHGHFPPPGPNLENDIDGQPNRDMFFPGSQSTYPSDDYRPSRGGFYSADDAYVYSSSASSVSMEHGGGSTVVAPVISCLEPSKLPAIFGPEWNNELAAPKIVFFEEKRLCAQLKNSCRACLVSCAEEIKSSSLTCKPTAGPADNGRSPRLETCFDCCAKDNCTYVCGKYSAHRCLMRLCSYGTRLDFQLAPEWPKDNPFICHVQPAPSRPIYRLRWSLLFHGRPRTTDTFTASLTLTEPIDGEQNEATWHQSQAATADHGVRRLPDGTLNQLHRGLLNVDYYLGLSHIPDIISGSASMQAAYYWSTQTIPLVQNAASNAYSGAGYGFLPPISPYPSAAAGHPGIPSLLVWPTKPFGVNTDLWKRLSAAPCASADPLLSKFNVYTPTLPPYIAMSDVHVEYKAPHLYSISHVRIKPKLNFSLPRGASVLGTLFAPASVDRGRSLQASLVLDLNYNVESSASRTVSVDPSGGHRSHSGAAQHRAFWVIDLKGQVSQFPGLFRLKVYPDDDNGVMQGSRDPEEQPNHESLPDSDPLLDYEIGVFEKKDFHLQILIPAPNHEPDYEKSFRLVILDAKNRLDVRVRRAVQPPVEMQQRRMYNASSESTLESLIALVPSLAARQMRETANQAAASSRTSKRDTDQASLTASNPTMKNLDLPIGPPAEVVYALPLFLLLLFVIYVLGHVTQPDPSHYWIGCAPAETSDANATTSAAVFTFRPPEKVTPLTYWRRVFVLVIYLCLKSAYTFSVTLTALIIVTRYFTREPAHRLANIAEWSGSSDFNNDQSTVSWARQKLLKDAMDAHLKTELRRQQNAAFEMHKACSMGIDKMFDKMEQAFDISSRRSASRRSRVLVSQAVAEFARVAASAAVLEFANGLSEFNTTAQWAMRRLKSDLEGTESVLASSDWLAGARIIYAEVARLRGMSPDPADPTRSFLRWAHILPSDDFAKNLPQFSLPPHLPNFNADKLRVPTPPMWPEAAPEASTATTGAGRTQVDDLPEDAYEIRYGPPYVPFVSNPIDMDSEQGSWTVYEDLEKAGDWTNDHAGGTGGGGDTGEQPSPPKTRLQEPAGRDADGEAFQLSWVHLLCFALFLDGLWLVHRVLHTVDTAERILYGEPIVIDCTEHGLKRRLMKRNRFRKGAKSAFKTFMRPDCVRRICAGTLALLTVCLASAHVRGIFSEDVLDYIGYYDNLMMDVHLHARFVNLHIVGSAKRLSQQELVAAQAHAEHRYQEAQFLLYHWTSWLNRVETEQCRVLLMFKEAARTLRSKVAAEEGLGVGMFSSNPWSINHLDPDMSTNQFKNGSSADEAYVPRHCRLSNAEREAELKELRYLEPPHCPIDVITPQIFKGYNASAYFAEVVAQSRGWLSAIQDWVSVFLTCLFAFVSTIILWNALGSVVWFFSLRFNLISRKVFYESDVASWRCPSATEPL